MAQKKRRIHSREFKLEAVRLIRDRGVSVAQASRDLDVHENLLRQWAREFEADPKQAFPGQGHMKPEQAEIERLRREVIKPAQAMPVVLASEFEVRHWLSAQPAQIEAIQARVLPDDALRMLSDDEASVFAGFYLK